ncbi:hypothetical protein HPB51_019137 [Rhipicephalus microplus]|uniref:Uncharacterized protein n=1 Tax=Rhipicephalus microplus TaxID=6941 RepID=A0A9J6EI69_RHIMP|nr:hypothetical protein HPB51_019137 [Rhipicephalus microplus]
MRDSFTCMAMGGSEEEGDAPCGRLHIAAPEICSKLACRPQAQRNAAASSETRGLRSTGEAMVIQATALPLPASLRVLANTTATMNEIAPTAPMHRTTLYTMRLVLTIIFGHTRNHDKAMYSISIPGLLASTTAKISAQAELHAIRVHFGDVRGGQFHRMFIVTLGETGRLPAFTEEGSGRRRCPAPSTPRRLPPHLPGRR